MLRSEGRWLTLKLEEAGKAEVGSGVTIADGAVIEVEHFIEIATERKRLWASE